MLLGGIEVQVPGEEIRHVLGVAVNEPEQAEPRHQDERSLRGLEQGDGSQRGGIGILTCQLARLGTDST